MYRVTGSFDKESPEYKNFIEVAARIALSIAERKAKGGTQCKNT